MCRCVTISHKHGDAASWFVSTVCMKARVYPNFTTSFGRKPRFWHTTTSAARLNSHANEWNSSKFLPNERIFSCNIKKFQVGILQHYWKLTSWSILSYQHYYYRISLLSLVSLYEINIWSNSAADKLTTSILFYRLLNCLMTSSILKGGLRMSLKNLRCWQFVREWWWWGRGRLSI